MDGQEIDSVYLAFIGTPIDERPMARPDLVRTTWERAIRHARTRFPDVSIVTALALCERERVKPLWLLADREVLAIPHVVAADLAAIRKMELSGLRGRQQRIREHNDRYR